MRVQKEGFFSEMDKIPVSKNAFDQITKLSTAKLNSKSERKKIREILKNKVD